MFRPMKFVHKYQLNLGGNVPRKHTDNNRLSKLSEPEKNLPDKLFWDRNVHIFSDFTLKWLPICSTNIVQKVYGTSNSFDSKGTGWLDLTDAQREKYCWLLHIIICLIKSVKQHYHWQTDSQHKHIRTHARLSGTIDCKRAHKQILVAA